MNTRRLSVELMVLYVTLTLAQSNIYYKGAYENEDAYLPCMPNEDIPTVNKQAIWWKTQGLDIGHYTEANGFQPSGNFSPDKFDITSLDGTLMVKSLDKTADSVPYNCGITSTNGTNYTDTTTIQLEIGNAPHDFYIYTNGSRIGSDCYDHVGFGPMNCSVISDPQSNITWFLHDHTGSNCEEALERTNTTCLIYSGDQFKCSSTLTPNYGCYGHYVCMANYKLGDLTRQIDECVLVVESDDWYVFYIILASVLALLVIIIIFVVILSCCGILACAGCASVMACAGCMECCDKRNVTPAQQPNTQEYAMHDSYVPTYTITNEQYTKPTDGNTAFGYHDDPPPYNDLKL